MHILLGTDVLVESQVYIILPHAEIICSELTAPDNGQVSYDRAVITSVQFQTTATYTCNSGYGLTGGNRSRVCDGDGRSYLGSWTGTAPGCGGK